MAGGDGDAEGGAVVFLGFGGESELEFDAGGWAFDPEGAIVGVAGVDEGVEIVIHECGSFGDDDLDAVGFVAGGWDVTGAGGLCVEAGIEFEELEPEGVIDGPAGEDVVAVEEAVEAFDLAVVDAGGDAADKEDGDGGAAGDGEDIGVVVE